MFLLRRMTGSAPAAAEPTKGIGLASVVDESLVCAVCSEVRRRQRELPRWRIPAAA